MLQNPADTRAEPRPIQLKVDGAKVVITPEDEDRFVRESAWAVAACRNQLMVDRFLEQFQSEFLTTLYRWSRDRDSRIVATFASHAGPHAQVFVVTRLGRFDVSLSDELSDLETDLFEQGWPCEVLQIPNGPEESRRSFFDPNTSIKVYGNTDAT